MMNSGKNHGDDSDMGDSSEFDGEKSDKDEEEKGNNHMKFGE